MHNQEFKVIFSCTVKASLGYMKPSLKNRGERKEEGEREGALLDVIKEAFRCHEGLVWFLL